MALRQTAVRNPAADATEILAAQLAEDIANISLQPEAETAPAPVEEDPDALDLSGVQAAMGRTKQLSEEISTRLEENMKMGDTQAKAVGAALTDQVKANQVIQLQADTAQLRAENATNDVFNALGGATSQVNRAERFRETEVDINSLLDERADIMDDEHSGVGFIDDIINEFRVVGTDQDLRRESTEQAQNLSNIQNATAIVQSAASTNQLVKRTVNEGTIAANQKRIAAAGEVQLYEATLAQNRSNAENLKTMLSVSSTDMQAQMRVIELQSSVEGRKLERERFAAQQESRALANEQAEITIRRSLIQEQVDALTLQLTGATTDTRIEAEIKALEQRSIDLQRSELALLTEQETIGDQIATTKLNRESAQVALETATLNLEEARALSPEKLKAAQASFDQAQTDADAAEFRFNELVDTTAERRGQLAANLTIVQNQAALSTATLPDTITAQQARAREAVRALADAGDVRAANAVDVQNYQSFIFGAQAVESAEVISSMLDNKDEFYLLMRQLGSAAGPNGEFIIGSNPAKANENLEVFESRGVVSNEIQGVKFLREVRNTQQQLWQESAVNIPIDDEGKAVQFNKLAAERKATKSVEIVFGDATNPFQPDTVPNLVSLSSTWAADPLAKVLTKNGQVDTNVDQIIEQGLVAVAAGGLTQDEVISGLVTLGNTIGITNATNHHGLEPIGLANSPTVNMRVARPRGFAASTFDSLAATASLRTFAILTPAVGGTVAKAAASLISGGADFTTINIADPVAVRAHIIAILSSTTLGGRSTPENLTIAPAATTLAASTGAE